MHKRSCPSCRKRLPYAARRCLHCGWTMAEGNRMPHATSGWRRRQLFWGGVFVLLMAGTASVALRNAEGIADWYAGFAAEHLAQPFSSWAPHETDRGAFFYCARMVARQMDGEFSVETFQASAATTQAVGNRRYRVISFVEQARADGERVRHDFTCEVRFDRGRWVLENLALEPYPDEVRTAGVR